MARRSGCATSPSTVHALQRQELGTFRRIADGELISGYACPSEGGDRPWSSHEPKPRRIVIRLFSGELPLVAWPADRLEHGALGRRRDRGGPPYRSSPQGSRWRRRRLVP